MPCAARQRQRTPLHRHHRLAQHRLQLAVAGGGGDAIILLGAEAQLAAPGNGLRLRQQLLQQRRQWRILRAANIQRQLHLARYHVHRARRTAQGADRRHQIAAALPGQAFHLHHPFRRRGERVLTMEHRHRAGMAGFAGKAAVQAAGAVNRLHYAERQTRLLQARPLLDMQFQIGGDILRAAGGMGDPRRIEPGIHQRLGDAHPAGIALRQPAFRPGASDAAAAKQGDAEAGALFIAKTDDLDSLCQPSPLLVQTLHHLNRRQHAEHAVVAPGVAHGVKMRAQQHRRRALLHAFIATADVADAVVPHHHTGGLHPLTHQLVGLQMLRRQIDPGQGVGGFAEGGQLVGARHYPAGGRLSLRLLADGITHRLPSVR